MLHRCLPLLLAATGLFAQGWKDHPRPMHRPGPGMFEEIQRMQVERLKHHLGIPEEKAKAIASRWSKYIWDSSTQARKSGQMRQQLEEILRSPSSEDEKNTRLKPLLDQFLNQRQAVHDLRKAFEDDIRVGLTPAQQARLIGMTDDFQRHLREGMREAVRRGGRMEQEPLP